MEENENKNKALKIYLKLENKKIKPDMEINTNVSQDFNFFNNK